MTEEKPKKPIWKKWWFITGIILVIIIIAASSGSDKGSSPTSNTATTTSGNESKKVYGLNEEAIAGKLTYVVSEIRTSNKIGKNEFLTKTTENQFIILKVKVTNNDKDSRTIDTNLFTLKDTQGKEYSAMAGADMYVNEDVSFFLEQVNPGTSKSGYIVFETPQGIKGLKLYCSSGLGFASGDSVIIDLGL